MIAPCLYLAGYERLHRFGLLRCPWHRLLFCFGERQRCRTCFLFIEVDGGRCRFCVQYVLVMPEFWRMKRKTRGVSTRLSKNCVFTRFRYSRSFRMWVLVVSEVTLLCRQARQRSAFSSSPAWIPKYRSARLSNKDVGAESRASSRADERGGHWKHWTDARRGRMSTWFGAWFIYYTEC